MSISEVLKRTLKTFKIFAMHSTSDLVSFASLKHGLMIVLEKIPFTSRKTIASYTRQGMVAKDEDSVSLFMNHESLCYNIRKDLGLCYFTNTRSNDAP